MIHTAGTKAFAQKLGYTGKLAGFRINPMQHQRRSCNIKDKVGDKQIAAGIGENIVTRQIRHLAVGRKIDVAYMFA